MTPLEPQDDRARLVEAVSSVVDVLVTSADCTTCSVAEVPDTAKTYAYFHAQDIERAFARPGHLMAVGDERTYKGQDRYLDEAITLVAPLYIGFGTSEDGSDYLARRVAHKIIKALNDAGFQTDWNRNVETRIRVTGVTTTRSLL